MGKRPAAEEDGHQAWLKRQRINMEISKSTSEEVHSAHQLQSLLSFDQKVTRSQHGIVSFKNFLESISDEDQSDRYLILKEFLKLQIPQEEDGNDLPYLGGIMQTWSLAAQSDRNPLLSAIPAVLALLFRKISGRFELVEYGLRLGRTLLQKAQLELLTRGLSSNKAKGFLVSPSLRLVREIAIFDGGALANQVFRARESTLRELARNLGSRHPVADAEDRKRPSVRTNSLRYFLALVKYLPVESRREFLKQRDIVSAVTRDVFHDPPHIVRDFLEITQAHILQNEKLPRDAKSKMLNSVGLVRLLTLYGYDQPEEHVPQNSKPIADLVHDYLILACTLPRSGLLHYQTGFYPRGSKPEENQMEVLPNCIDHGLETLEDESLYEAEGSIYNTSLFDFIQSLKPWSDVRHSELLLAIFKAAPELVAYYFFAKKSFTFEPKLTATWIGYSALLFSVIQLPLPIYFGNRERYAHSPPPLSLMMESILPRPLTQKILTRCLGQKVELISFFAIRLLIIAFEKLELVLAKYEEAESETASLWSKARTALVAEFSKRCPLMKDVINAFRTTPDSNTMKRHVVSKLLSKYYKILPHIALDSKFDISVALTSTMKYLAEPEYSAETAFRILDTENLLDIGNCSPNMRWFHKADSQSLSPFTAMLKVFVESSSNIPLPRIHSIMTGLGKESSLLQSEQSLDALVTGIRLALENRSDPKAVYEFIDGCALRCSTHPVKYIETAEAALSTSFQQHHVHTGASLLLYSTGEQWPFVVKSEDGRAIESIATFISNYFAASIKIAEDYKSIKSLIDIVVASCPENSTARGLLLQTEQLVADIDVQQVRQVLDPPQEVTDKHSDIAQERARMEAELTVLVSEDLEDQRALQRWTAKDIDDVLEGSAGSDLILLLSSIHLAARKEALTNLTKLAHKVNDSSHSEKQQIWVLLSELIETARPHISDAPLPNIITAFAVHALAVLQDPLHTLYPKVNAFLTRKPSWDITKIPLLHAVLREPPTLDGARETEIIWLVQYLTAALRRPSDLDVFRKRRVVEKLLVLYSNPYTRPGLKMAVWRLLYAITGMAGGSDTLITRASILSWVQARRALEKERSAMRMAGEIVWERLLATCDAERVEAWTGKKMAQLTLEA